MDSLRLPNLWSKVRWVRPWHFLILALIFGAVCVHALRANNQHMVKLRAAVYSADKQGTDVQKPLQALQAYVTTHMNTSLSAGNSVYPPIQLQNTYNRLVKAQEQSQNSTALYTQAQHHCEQLDPVDFSGHNRVPCIESYVKTHGGKASSPIPPSLYEFSFASPSWSPDLAGWSLLATIFSLLVFAGWSLGRKITHRR